MIPSIPKKYKKLVFHIFWPFIWPLQPSLAFFNYFEVLEVLEVQWHALGTYLTLLSSERIIVENFPFLITVVVNATPATPVTTALHTTVTYEKYITRNAKTFFRQNNVCIDKMLFPKVQRQRNNGME